MTLDDLLTDRAAEWLARMGAVVRLAMLLFIAYALWHRLGAVDAGAAAFAAFLVVRALRPKASGETTVTNVHVHSNISNGVDVGARARAIEKALKRSIDSA